MAFELLSALTLWAIAAFYTSSVTQPSLAVEDNYTGGRMTDTDTGERPSGDDAEYETETQTAESDDEEAPDSQQRQSLASLQARDARELYEQRRAELLRDELEGRRMTAVDQPATGALEDLELTQGRRVLGRLDEETEEETDVHASETSAGWEDVGEEEDDGVDRTGETIRVEDKDAFSPAEGSQLPAGLRRRQVKEEEDEEGSPFRRESTVGGSSTSRASTVRSFGATSLGTSVPSRSQTEATPEVKEEEEAEEEEEEGDDTEREVQ